jgi:hypothetical protein
MISNKQRTALVAVAVLVLAVAGPILADMLQAHQTQAQWWRHRHWGWHRHWWRGHWWGWRGHRW